MSIVICPGIHSPELTDSFLLGLRSQLSDLPQNRSLKFSVFPANQAPVYSPHGVLAFLRQFSRQPLLLIAFSAGVVGAIGAARLWQKQGGTIQALIALDGWGVPLAGDFPIHRVSHDYLTHWSSALMGKGSDSFYADPPVTHLDLWRSPQTTQGHHIASDPDQPGLLTRDTSPVTAATFITALLQKYEPDLQANT